LNLKTNFGEFHKGATKIDERKRSPERLIFRMPGVRAFRLPIILAPRPTNPFSSSIMLMYAFAGFILLGTVFLIFPISSASGQFTPPVTALFTATSAVTLTGLNVVETGLYWSTFGQAVIFILFEFGGFGFVIGAMLLLLAIGGRFGLRDRLLIGESLGVEHVGGVIGLVVKVAIYTLVIQMAGALLFYLHWSQTGASQVSLWTAFFHSASAFNNCGFDIFGNSNSMLAFRQDTATLLITAVLIIIGSIGYIVLTDIFRKKGFIRLTLDIKVILVTTLGLYLLGTLVFFMAEYSGVDTLGSLPISQKLVAAFFQSVTPRTAGFTLWDFNQVHSITLLFTLFLMAVGGAVGSTAGGFKVNTFGVIWISAWNTLRGKEHIGAFGRQITKQTVLKSLTLVFFYFSVAAIGVCLLSITEKFPLDKIMFEVISALSTVGLSTGITPELTTPSRFILMAAMFIGRLGPLTLIAYIVHHKQKVELEYPHENIRLG
jgi:trk system potassium uptake protein